MKHKTRNTSPELSKSANPGAEKNARAHRTGNPSGGTNYNLPTGRGTGSNDHAAAEKQNQ